MTKGDLDLGDLIERGDDDEQEAKDETLGDLTERIKRSLESGCRRYV